MKFKGIFALCLAGVSMTAMAQTHVDGEEYYKADQLENAKDLLKRSLSNPQTDKAVSDYYLGLIAFEEGKDSEAANYFSQGISANPEYAYNYVGQGLLKLKAGDQKGAEELFKTADKNSKKDASLQIAIARAYDRVDPVRYEKQITKQVEKARKFNMENPDIYIFEGDQFKDQVKNADQSLANTLVGKAAGMYEMAANYDKNATAAYVKYANLFTMVNPDYAIKMLNNLLSVNPTSALGQRELANAYYNKKDYANAAKQYAAYVQNPSHFKSDESRYAFLLFYGQDFNNGYDYASKLLAEDPSNFTAQRYQFMNAAQIKEMKDQLLPMAEALYAAHKANPDKNKFAAIDYTLIAAELTDAKRPAEAVAVLEEGIKDIPDNLNFYKQLANVYVDENDLAKASDTYALYLAKNDEAGYNDFVQQAPYAYFAGAQNLQADPAKSQKYLGIASEYATRASNMAENQYKPVKILGDIAIAQAPNDEARKSAGQPLYEKAIVLLENSADPSRYTSDAKSIYSYLGNYYVGKDNIAKAKEYFNKYLQLAPNDEAVRDYVSKLK